MGITEGIWVIAIVGANVGDLDGMADGSFVGTSEGVWVVDGSFVGTEEGERVRSLPSNK